MPRAKWNIYITPPPLKTQASSQRRRWKDSKARDYNKAIHPKHNTQSHI